MKRLISANKPASPSQLIPKKNMVDQFSDNIKINELDKLFIQNYEVNKKKKVRKNMKKITNDGILEKLEKKIKTEENSIN